MIENEDDVEVYGDITVGDLKRLAAAGDRKKRTGPSTENLNTGIMMHDIYLGMTHAGFTPEQATQIVAAMAAGAATRAV